MDIIELVESRRNNNEIPKGMTKKTFGAAETVILFYIAILLLIFTGTFFTSKEFKLGISKKEITNAVITETKDEATNWKFFLYAYTVEDDTIKYNFDVSIRSSLYKLRVGDSIKIEYAINNPRLHKIVDLKDNNNMFLEFLPMLIIFLIFAITLSVFLIKKIKIKSKQLTIWQNGMVVIGKLIFVEKESKFFNLSTEIGFNNKAIIEYEIDNKVIRSSTMIKNLWLVSQWKQGDTVTIMVDKDDKEKIVAIEEFVY